MCTAPDGQRARFRSASAVCFHIKNVIGKETTDYYVTKTAKDCGKLLGFELSLVTDEDVKQFPYIHHMEGLQAYIQSRYAPSVGANSPTSFDTGPGLRLHVVQTTSPTNHNTASRFDAAGRQKKEASGVTSRPSLHPLLSSYN